MVVVLRAYIWKKSKLSRGNRFDGCVWSFAQFCVNWVDARVFKARIWELLLTCDGLSFFMAVAVLERIVSRSRSQARRIVRNDSPLLKSMSLS